MSNAMKDQLRIFLTSFKLTDAEIQAFTDEAESIEKRNQMSKSKSYYFPDGEETNASPTHDMQIIVQSRDAYGVTKVYPVCKDALHFAAIAGTTTLTTRTLNNILALGYGIIYE